MPTPKTKRDILLQSSFSSTDVVATLSLGFEAQFETPEGTVTANLFQDSSAGTSDELTAYQMAFGSGTSQIGLITLSFSGSGEAAVKGLSVEKTRANSVFDPTETVGTVTPIASPAAIYSRIWQQAALDASSVEQVDQIGSLEVRVKGENNHTVIQTVTSTATALLVLSYTWKAASGADVITGTVKLAASSVAGSGYSLGTATVDDNDGLASSITAARKANNGRALGRTRR